MKTNLPVLVGSTPTSFQIKRKGVSVFTTTTCAVTATSRSGGHVSLTPCPTDVITAAWRDDVGLYVEVKGRVWCVLWAPLGIDLTIEEKSS